MIIMKIISFAYVAYILFLLTGNASSAIAQRTTFHGSVHPLAIAGIDNGLVAPDMRIEGIQIYLTPSQQQWAALSQLIVDQRTPGNAFYRQWLTPKQFGEQFGASSENETAVKQWLYSQGFTEVTMSHSRMMVRFSGSASLVAEAFDTQIHSITSSGEKHYANLSDVSVPESLENLVYAVRGLDDFRPLPLYRKVSPQFTTTAGGHDIAPGDIAAIYDIQNLYNSGIDGSGVTIAVVGQSDIDLADVAAYRKGFGLSANVPTIVMPYTDPGTIPANETEADIDLEIAGAVARNATILYVNTSDVFDSMDYAIDNNLAQIISFSYCLAESPIASIYTPFELSALQANAQGITIVAASGDAGADGAGPDSAGGLCYPSSLPEVTGVGGTDFVSPDSSYFTASNSTTGGSATGYIPEVAWSLSGGGASAIFAKPAWQVGEGVPDDGARDIPDVAFYSISNNAGYVICTSGDCLTGSPNPPSFGMVVGGTSASTPIFAGILALLNNHLVKDGIIKAPGLGNVNPSLYLMAETTPTVFHDIVQGSNTVLCTIPTCENESVGFSAGPGYDQVTGLGSVDAYQLITQWNNSVLSGTTTTISLSTYAPVEGQPVTITAKVVNNSANETIPDGTVEFFVGQSNSTSLGTAALNQNGIAALTTGNIPAGQETIYAVYWGSLAFGQSDDNVSVSVTKNTLPLENTTTTLAISIIQTSPAEIVLLTATVTPASGITIPTGTVSFYSGATPLQASVAAEWNTPAGGNPNTNQYSVTVEKSDLPGGVNSITAQYSGSSIFAASTSSATTITVLQSFAISAAQTTLTVEGGSSVSTTLTITPSGGGSNPSVTFACSGLATGDSCTFGSPVPQTNGTQNVTITINTLASEASTGNVQNTSRLPIFAVFPFVGILALKKRGKTILEKAQMILTVMALTVIGAGIAGCSSGLKASPNASGKSTSQVATVIVTAQAAGYVNTNLQLYLTVE